MKHLLKIGLLMAMILSACSTPDIDAIKDEVEQIYPHLNIEWINSESCEGVVTPAHWDATKDMVVIDTCVPDGWDAQRLIMASASHEDIHATGETLGVWIVGYDTYFQEDLIFNRQHGFMLFGDDLVVAGWDEFPAYACQDEYLDQFTQFDEWIDSLGFSCSELLMMRETSTGLQELCAIVFEHPDIPCTVNELLVGGNFLGVPDFVGNATVQDFSSQLKYSASLGVVTTNQILDWELPTTP